MRLCANVPMQHAIQTALGGYQSISEFILPGGRLYEQRNRAWELINQRVFLVLNLWGAFICS